MKINNVEFLTKEPNLDRRMSRTLKEPDVFRRDPPEYIQNRKKAIQKIWSNFNTGHRTLGFENNRAMIGWTCKKFGAKVGKVRKILNGDIK